jgi:hypothetical protein
VAATDPEKTELEAAREIGKLISDFRVEVADKIRQDFEKEAHEMEEAGYDPARGRGRGPFWADGG